MTIDRHSDSDFHTNTGAWGSEPMLLEFRSGQLNSSRTSCNSQPPMTLHPFDGSGEQAAHLPGLIWPTMASIAVQVRRTIDRSAPAFAGTGRM